MVIYSTIYNSRVTFTEKGQQTKVVGFVNSTFVDAKTHKTIYSSFAKYTTLLELSVYVRDNTHYVVGANIL